MAVAKRQRLSLAPVRSGSREKRVGYHGRPVADRPRTCRGKRDAVRGWKEKIVAAILPSECDRATARRPEPRNEHGGEGQVVDSMCATRRRSRSLHQGIADREPLGEVFLHWHGARRKQLLAAFGQPAVARSRLTLRAVPVPAAVVGDGAMSTASALIDVAAEYGSAARSNGP